MPRKMKPAYESVASRADMFFTEAFGTNLCYKWATSNNGVDDFKQYFKSLEPVKQLNLIADFLDAVGRTVARGTAGRDILRPWEKSNEGVYNEETRTHRPKGVTFVKDNLHIGVVCTTQLKFADLYSITFPTVEADSKGSHTITMTMDEFLTWMGEMIASSNALTETAVEGWLTNTATKIWGKLTGRKNDHKGPERSDDPKYQRNKDAICAKYINDGMNTVSKYLRYIYELNQTIGHTHFNIADKGQLVLGLNSNVRTNITNHMWNDKQKDDSIEVVGVKGFNNLYYYGLEQKDGKIYAIVYMTSVGPRTVTMEEIADICYFIRIDDLRLWPIKCKAIAEMVKKDYHDFVCTSGKGLFIPEPDPSAYDLEDFIEDEQELILAYADLRQFLTDEDHVRISKEEDMVNIMEERMNKSIELVCEWVKKENAVIKSKFKTDQCYLEPEWSKYDFYLSLLVGDPGSSRANESTIALLPGMESVGLRLNVYVNESLHQHKYKGAALVRTFIDMCTRHPDVIRGEEGKALVEKWAEEHGYKVRHSKDVWYSGEWTETEFKVLYVPFKTGKSEHRNRMQMLEIVKHYRVENTNKRVDEYMADRRAREQKGAKDYYNEKYGVTESWLTGNFQ